MVMIRKPWIDFKKYRHRKYLEAVCDAIGGVVLWKGMSYVRSHCPLCCGGGKRSSRVGWWNFATGFYHCHNCKVTTDAIGMVCRVMKCEAVEACKWLEEEAGVANSGYVPGKPSKN